MDWLKCFNDNYANAVTAITPFIIGIISWLYYSKYKESKLKEGDAALIVKPKFIAFGKKYRILAVHRYEKSNDPSGYSPLGQNSRKDQWEKLIRIKSTFFDIKHEIVPIDEKDILTIIISRNGKEKWHIIEFNK